jgi:hypothetical protein
VGEGGDLMHRTRLVATVAGPRPGAAEVAPHVPMPDVSILELYANEDRAFMDWQWRIADRHC